jgi:hypothetical protein
MRNARDMSSLFSNFYLDGEAAFMDGASLDQNPYRMGDDAATGWRAGWLAASHAASMVVATRPDSPLYDPG